MSEGSLAIFILVVFQSNIKSEKRKVSTIGRLVFFSKLRELVLVGWSGKTHSREWFGYFLVLSTNESFASKLVKRVLMGGEVGTNWRLLYVENVMRGNFAILSCGWSCIRVGVEMGHERVGSLHVLLSQNMHTSCNSQVTTLHDPPWPFERLSRGHGAEVHGNSLVRDDCGWVFRAGESVKVCQILNERGSAMHLYQAFGVEDSKCDKMPALIIRTAVTTWKVHTRRN